MNATDQYRYQKRWRLERSRGITRLVPADATITHIRTLLAAGVSRRAIAERAEISPTNITRLLRGDQPTLRRVTARRILTMQPADTFTRTAPDGFVPNVGARRRIQALMACGYAAHHISAACGREPALVYNILNASGDWLTHTNYRHIVTVYNQLWDTPGPSTLSRDRARKRGFLPPMAWDDDTIDDPNASPNIGQPNTRDGGVRSANDVTEDIEFLLEHDLAATCAQLAYRLGYTSPDGIQRALARTGRNDLLRQLARNAELHTPPRKKATA